MRITWIECQQRFSGLSSREQWLIAISGWVAIGFIGVFMVLEPQWLQLKSQMNNVQTTTNNAIAIRNNITVLQRQLAQDPNKDIEVKIAQLTQKNTQLVQQLQQKIGGLVTPTQMPNILEQVLRHSKELRLQSIVSLPAAQLISGEDQGYYIHPLRMTFEGKYFDVIRYLTQLEALPVNYYWRNLNYQVMQYPWAKIELELYTLGESKDFIGG
ncbi:MSHA biogenesis protein MshJ [Photobacterium kishitanii]|uniref:MSHA biogenesis protein MshJ n=1 Tax=Photobacterium kishitanii TaxID=318456 RepID=A0AAX0YUK0_9GAMM|nr:MSHA biogenesis protein MshJ [Photobacterium kishitanii]KJG57688.1 MSHA biogenesis protein MshJ [Photobacterium kishitanii]KJG61301.1 MSHA biogenesis protein MshJ [Photobacterium kishitanii]KJG65617.1 MSHA biogenesis protein MshJ [Photobacterium kishitanii]KJG70454.1 MSHA biogenesis protein MshJ [Photobacterium kishitanii]PSV14533.1 MSHA biogenesis protein MshJ [Photobacterium kishitanii]